MTLTNWNAQKRRARRNNEGRKRKSVSPPLRTLCKGVIFFFSFLFSLESPVIGSPNSSIIELFQQTGLGTVFQISNALHALLILHKSPTCSQEIAQNFNPRSPKMSPSFLRP